MSARVQRALHTAWRKHGLLAWLLSPLALLHRAWRGLNVWCYRSGLLRPWRVGVPIVVIGNLYVGGTGKTPLTIEVVRALAARGWRPGIVSRGYGTSRSDVRPVGPTAKPSEVGDEPVLMAQSLGAPVVVGRDRVAACRILLSLNPGCNVIVTDDGLQHRRLARDIEIAVLDERGLGNGWLLPAGPLREPAARLGSVDAVVCNGAVPAVRIHSPRFEMRTAAGEVQSLADPSRSISLDGLREEQQRSGLRIVAAAGIGVPQRFFAMLCAVGLQIDELPLADHFDFASNPFAGRSFDVALITAKDAVKCRLVPALAADGRLCVVNLRASVDPGLIDLIESRITPPTTKAANGPTPA